MEFNKSFIRTNSGALISSLTGRRYCEGQEAQLIKDNERHTEAANLRARAAGEPNPTPRQIRTGEFGDSRSVTTRIADDLAAKNPRAAVNPYTSALAVNRSKQENANFQDKRLEVEAEQLRAKEADFNSRRQTLATLPNMEPAPVDDLRTAADALRSAPKQVGEGNWRQAAADAIERKADTRDAEQRAAEIEQARQNDPLFQRSVLCATAQLRQLELRGDVSQPDVNAARKLLTDVQSGACSPVEFWAVHQPAHVEKMTAIMGAHKAEIERRQTEVDAYAEQAREGMITPPAEPPAQEA